MLKRTEYEIKWNCFQQGQRCLKCFIKNHSENKKLTYSYVKQQIENEEYKLLSKNYIDAHIKLKIKCPKGHEYKTASYHSFQRGKRCPICWNERLISKAEKKILEIVNNTLPNDKIIIANDRTQILNPLTNKNLELDVYIPRLDR